MGDRQESGAGMGNVKNSTIPVPILILLKDSVSVNKILLVSFLKKYLGAKRKKNKNPIVNNLLLSLFFFFFF